MIIISHKFIRIVVILWLFSILVCLIGIGYSFNHKNQLNNQGNVIPDDKQLPVEQCDITVFDLGNNTSKKYQATSYHDFFITYTDSTTNKQIKKKYSVSFNCPPDSSILRLSDSDVVINTKANEKHSKNRNLSITVTETAWVYYKTLDKTKPIQSWLQDLLEQTYPGVDFSVATFEKISVNGKEYLKASNFPKYEMNGYAPVPIKNTTYYIPFFQPEIIIADNVNLSEDVLNQVLGSLEISR